MSTVISAREFAERAHGAQLYGTRPYVDHLTDVARELDVILHAVPALRFYDHTVAIKAAFLHDVLEDTNTQPDEIEDKFGDRVLELVESVTDGPGKNRAERKSGVYAQIARTGILSCALKLADRIANVKASIAENRQDLLAMYRKEQDGFAKALDWRYPELMPIWDALNTLLRG